MSFQAGESYFYHTFYVVIFNHSEPIFSSFFSTAISKLDYENKCKSHGSS